MFVYIDDTLESSNAEFEEHMDKISKKIEWKDTVPTIFVCH